MRKGATPKAAPQAVAGYPGYLVAAPPLPFGAWPLPQLPSRPRPKRVPPARRTRHARLIEEAIVMIRPLKSAAAALARRLKLGRSHLSEIRQGKRYLTIAEEDALRTFIHERKAKGPLRVTPKGKAKKAASSTTPKSRPVVQTATTRNMPQMVNPHLGHPVAPQPLQPLRPLPQLRAPRRRTPR